MNTLLIASALALVLGAPAATAGAAPDTLSYSSEEALDHYAVGRSLEEIGQIDDALREYYRALTLDPRSPSLTRRISEVAARQGDAARSLEVAERGLKVAPGDPQLLWLRGAALYNLGRTEEAIGPLEAAVRADTTQVAYTRTLAQVAQDAGRPELLIEAWQRTTRLTPEDGEAWFQLAAAEARLGGYDAASEALDHAKELAPTRPGILFLEGWIREGQGRRAEAIDLFQRHLQIHDDPSVRRRLVQLLAREGRWNDAYLEAERVSKAEPEDVIALEITTDLAFRAGRTKDADRLVEKLRSAAGTDPERMLRIVGLLARNHRAKQGVAMADAWAPTARPPHGDEVAAEARALAGDSTGAEARARSAVAAAPESLSARALLAGFVEARHDYAAAESVWAGALAHGGDSLGVLLEIALCREQAGRFPEAEQAANAALQFDPENPRALNFLGYLLADHGSRLDEALRLIQHALARDPDNGAFIDSLGWVYYRLGRLGEARTELERAVVLTHGDPVVHEHLGDVYKQLKLLDLAREQYRLSLAADGTNPQVRAKLNAIH